VRGDGACRLDDPGVGQGDEEEILGGDVWPDDTGVVGAGEDASNAELYAGAQGLQLWRIVEARVQQARVPVRPRFKVAHREQEFREPIPRVIGRESLVDLGEVVPQGLCEYGGPEVCPGREVAVEGARANACGLCDAVERCVDS